MPAVTLGSTVASVIQFIVVVGMLIPALTTHTQTGAGILPASYLATLNGTINFLNSSFIATSGPYSLQQQMVQIINTSASNINPGILQSLGGLAFIPAAFGVFMKAAFNIPGVVVSLFGAMLTNTGSVILPFSILLISAGFSSYFIIIYAFKLITPITKVETEDI